MSDSRISDAIEEKTGVDIGVSDQTIAIGYGAAVAGFAAYAAHALYENHRHKQAVRIREFDAEQAERIRNLDADGSLPINDPREIMSNQLLMRGHATVDELLQASYGEWPPKGLDIITQNPQTVSFGDIKERVEEGLSDALGDATLVGKRRIRMNHEDLYEKPSQIGKSAYTFTLGHETTHILQGDNFYRLGEAYGAHSAVIKEQQMVLDKNDRVARIFSSFPNHDAPHTDVDKKWIASADLESGIEVQARIHEIIIDGYQKWGSVPTSPEEFMVAMKNSGLDIPDDVFESFKSSPTFEQTDRAFGTSDVSKKSPVNAINLIQKGITEEGRLEFWNKAMPELYVDLIEMYGDGPGRARFGMGENIRPALRAEVMIDRYVGAQSRLEDSRIQLNGENSSFVLDEETLRKQAMATLAEPGGAAYKGGDRCR